MAFVHQFGSLLQAGGVDLALVALLQDLNDSTWFVIDGSDQIVQTLRGTRPSESIADLIIIFCLQEVIKEVRTILCQSPFCMSLPLASNGILSAQLGTDTCTDEAEAVYANDAMRGFMRSDPFFIVSAISCHSSGDCGTCTQ